MAYACPESACPPSRWGKAHPSHHGRRGRQQQAGKEGMCASCSLLQLVLELPIGHPVPSPLQNVFWRPLEQGTTHGHPPHFAVSLPSPISPPEQILSGLLSLLMLLSHPAAGASLLSNVSTIQIKLQGALIQLSSSHLCAAAEGQPRTNRNPRRGTTRSSARGKGGSKDPPGTPTAQQDDRRDERAGQEGREKDMGILK